MKLDVSIDVVTMAECPTSQEIKSWIAETFLNENIKISLKKAIIAIRIVDKDEMQQMNSHYRQKNKPTNVLSFPCQLPEDLKGDQLGDIMICAPVVNDEAHAQNKSVQSHWAHMVIHGVLHLLGYDHVKTDEAEQMESLEIGILQQLGFPNPYGAIITHD